MVRYLGQPIAGVAAISQRAADAAAALVKVSYDALPHVSDMDEAMKPDAPAVFPDQQSNPRRPGAAVRRPGSLNEGTCAARTPGRPSACREAT